MKTSKCVIIGGQYDYRTYQAGGDRMTALRTKWLDCQPSTSWQRLYRAAALHIIDAVSTEYAAPGATIAHRIRTVGNMLADRAESAGSVCATEAYHFAVGLLERDADGETPV